MDSRRGYCRNCYHPLTGEYCSNCGQREGRRDLRFSDAAGEVLGDVFTWDSRLWRTLLPLLLRPGFLAAEYMAGRRARYVPPLRLYLIISFVLFLALSLGNSLSGIDFTIDAGAPPATESVNAPDAATGNDLPDWLGDLRPRLEENAAVLADNPGLLAERILDYLPQMMFLLLPVFALLLKLCYLASGYHYLQHLVFACYFHSFVYLLYLASSVLERWNLQVDTTLLAILALYLPLGLRRAYGSGIAGAAGKALFLFSAYGALLILGFAVVAVLALAYM